MLVLTRKFQEKIRIGNNITITVFRIKGKAVRLGIDAPSDVTVLRGELSFFNETERSVDLKPIALDITEAKKRSHVCSTQATTRPSNMTRSALLAPTAPSGTEPKIELVRVPRNRVPGIIPRLISSNLPVTCTQVE
jgi:carbon storage regulator CsrA